MSITPHFNMGDIALAMLENPDVKKEWEIQQMRYKKIGAVLQNEFEQIELFGDIDKKWDFLRQLGVKILSAVADADANEFRM